MFRTRLSTSGVPSPVTRSYPGPALSTAFPPRVTSRKAGSIAPAAIRYSKGLRSPIACPPFAIRYWFITAASPAQIGADCEVPPPTTCCCLNTIRTPVNGSATAAMSGVNRLLGVPIRRTRPRCHSGRSNSADTPPPVPWDSGTSNQACSASHAPLASVDRVVPPTLVISGSDATESSPISARPGGDDQSCPPLHSRPARSPLALNAVVPCDWRGGQGGPHRGQVGGGDQLVAAPADGEAPHRAGELPVRVLQHLTDLLVAAVALDGRTGVDHDLLRIGRDGMGDFEIHRQFRRAVRWVGRRPGSG